MSQIEDDILLVLGRRKRAPTIHALRSALSPKWSYSTIDAALARMLTAGQVLVTNGLWYRRDRMMVDNRKPKGPKRLDPKSAEARTLPLEFFK